MIWGAVAGLYDAAAGDPGRLRRENRALGSAARVLARDVASRDAELARLQPRAALADEALETLDELHGRISDTAGRFGLRGGRR